MRLVVVAVSMAVVAAILVNRANGHGRLADPPPRNSVMNEQNNRKVKYSPRCSIGKVNYKDTRLYCGSRLKQKRNGGLCSACGDDYAQKYPRKHDFNGSSGIVKKITPVRVYLQGQNITARVHISGQHLGWFQFRICNLNEEKEVKAGRYDALTKCFNDDNDPRNKRLKLTDGSLTYYGDTNDPNVGINRDGNYYVPLQLPKTFVCPNGCSFQWKYITNNRPKKSPETFVNCADIAIISCADYKAGKIPKHCGYGPTEELKTCTLNAEPSGGSQQQTDQTWQDQTIDDYQNGDTWVSDESGGAQITATGGGELPYQTGIGPGYESGNLAPTEPSVCDECPLEENCVHPSCVKTFASQHSSLNDWWCNINCNKDPPYCPQYYCRAKWVPKSEYNSKRFLNLLDEVLRKDSQDGDLDDDDGEPYGK